MHRIVLKFRHRFITDPYKTMRYFHISTRFKPDNILTREVLEAGLDLRSSPVLA